MAKVIVYHSSYGCDTGCCGHLIELTNDDDIFQSGEFYFNHPWGVDHRAWAEDLIRNELGDDHVKDLDWDNSMVLEA